jgi:hypothetical protein
VSWSVATVPIETRVRPRGARQLGLARLAILDDFLATAWPALGDQSDAMFSALSFSFFFSQGA